MQKLLHSIRQALELESGDDSTEDSGYQVKPVVLNAQANVSPIEGWRFPRTTTTLSWADGELSAAWVTIKDGTAPDHVVKKLNEDLAGVLEIHSQDREEDVGDAIQDGENNEGDEEKCEDQLECDAHDFEYLISEGDEKENEHHIPKDLDGWHWAFSDSESDEEGAMNEMIDKTGYTMDLSHETESKEKGDAHVSGKNRVAEQRKEYLELKEAGLVLKPEGSTLGVHPGACVWRGSYPGSKHYGRTWGTNRTPKKALLEILKLIFEDHVKLNPKDKIAKSQLSRLTKAWQAE
eukprot:s826_g22.t1